MKCDLPGSPRPPTTPSLARYHPRHDGRAHPHPRRAPEQPQEPGPGSSPAPAHGDHRARRGRGRAPWPWTRSSPRGSAGTWSRCPPTPSSFWSGWRSRTVDRVDGISPAVAIEQKNPTKTSRSTVGTATEVYDYLRLLWSRVGTDALSGVRTARTTRHRERCGGPHAGASGGHTRPGRVSPSAERPGHPRAGGGEPALHGLRAGARGRRGAGPRRSRCRRSRRARGGPGRTRPRCWWWWTA